MRPKADGMERTLTAIAETDPGLAQRMFTALSDCVGCYDGCLARTLYVFGGEKRFACHGRVALRMCEEDLRDVRAFLTHLNESVKG